MTETDKRDAQEFLAARREEGEDLSLEDAQKEVLLAKESKDKTTAYDSAVAAQKKRREQIENGEEVQRLGDIVAGEQPGVRLAKEAIEDISKYLTGSLSAPKAGKPGVDRGPLAFEALANAAYRLSPYMIIDLPQRGVLWSGRGKLRVNSFRSTAVKVIKQIETELADVTDQAASVNEAIRQTRADNLQEAVDLKRAEPEAAPAPAPLPTTPAEHTPLSADVIEQSTLRTASGESVQLPQPTTLDEIEAIDNIDEAFLDMKPSELAEVANARGIDVEDFRLDNGRIDVVELAKTLSKQDSDAIRSQRLVADATEVEDAPATVAAQRAEVEDLAEEAAPQMSREEAVTQLDDIADALSSGGAERARERSVRVSRLIRESRDLRSMTRQEIADRIFADLDFDARRRVASSGAIDELIDDITNTIDKRIDDVAKEINKLRRQTRIAQRKAETSRREETRRNYRDAAARYQRQADTMQEFLDDVLRKEKVDLADSMSAALDEQAARRAADEAAAPAPEPVRAPEPEAAPAPEPEAAPAPAATPAAAPAAAPVAPVAPAAAPPAAAPPAVDVDALRRRVARQDREDRRGRPPGPPAPPRTPTDRGASAPDARAMVYFMDDSSAIIYALKNADASSGLHEMSHVLRRHLRKPDLEVTLEWVNSQLRRTEVDGQTVEALPEVYLDRYGNFKGRADSVVTAEELFAEAHEQYLREGRAPTKGMEKVFQIMKDLLRSIVDTLSIVPHRLEVSREMNDVFDSIYGARRELDITELTQVSRYYDTQRELLGRGENLRRAGRLESDLVVENELTDRFRQRLLSLQDYSSRHALFGGFQYKPEMQAMGVTAPGRVGARGLGTKGAVDYGPVTRRFLPMEAGARIIGEEATTSDVTLKKVLNAADMLAVTAANAAVFLPYTFLYGTDAMMLLRSAPTAARPLLYGQGRELEEFTYGLTVLINDISRRTGDARARSIDDLINYLEGNSVYLLTGAERGTRTRGTSVNGGDAFFSMLDQMLSRLAPEAQDVLYAQASRVLSGDMTATQSLSGFWKGYSVKVAGRTYGESNGLLLDNQYLDLVTETTARGDTINLDGPTKDALGELFQVIQGEAVGNGVNVGDDAQKVAALLMFHSGKSTFMRNGVEVTIEMARTLGGEATDLGLLMRGTTIEIGGQSIQIPGLTQMISKEGVAVRTLLSLGLSGASTRILSDAAEIGLGVTTSQFRSYAKFVSGQQARMTSAQIDEAQMVARKFGLSMAFSKIESRDGAYYIPTPALKRLREARADGVRLLALRPQGDKSQDIVVRLLSWLFQITNTEAIFGSIIGRSTFRTASTLDAITGAATVGGSLPAKATAARMGSGTVLGIGLNLGLPGGELVSAERFADMMDMLPNAVRQKLMEQMGVSSSDEIAEGMKSVLRQFAATQGDRLANIVTDAASNAKYRVEVLPIMNNDKDIIFVLGGSPYRASDLRRVFVRNGLYNNAFKGVTSFLRAEGATGYGLGVEDFISDRVSRGNRRALSDRVDMISASDLASQGLGKSRAAMSAVFEHGLESMDALADFERTGMAVSFMEMGVPPELAAKMVVKAVYDYRGSLTSADRTLFKRMFMPFFGFQKNAMAHFTDLLASPRGRFFARVIGRMPRMSMEALSTLYFETVVGPYGVNTTAMNEAEINLYYEARAFFELGLGEDVSAEDLSVYREMLPEEDKDISDEELMDYSFKGWTIREGYNGYDNVPEDMRATLRYMLLARGRLRAKGRYVHMSDAVLDTEAGKQFREMGATLAVVDEPSMAKFPAYAANRYPALVISPAVMTNSIQEMQRVGMDTSFSIMLPDNFVNAGFEQTGALIATAYAASELIGATTGTDPEVEAAARMLLNAATPMADVRRGSPGLKAFTESVEALSEDEGLYVELDPFLARQLAGAFVPVQYTEGAEGVEDNQFLDRISPRLRKMIATGLAGGIPRDVEYPFNEARTAVISEEGGRRTIKYLDQDYEVVGRHESVRKKPFLMGRDALLFKQSPLGRVNTAMLRLRRSTQEDALQAEADLKNEMIRLMLTMSRSAGLRVMGANEEMTARMEQPELLVNE